LIQIKAVTLPHTYTWLAPNRQGEFMKRALLLDAAIGHLSRELENEKESEDASKAAALIRLKAVRENICSSPDLCGSTCTICRDDLATMSRRLLRET
jgi:hypothetical protein